MAEKYRYDSNSNESIVSRLRSSIQKYKDAITDWEKLIEVITYSNDWQDVSVKEAFSASAQTYIDSYKKFALQMEAMNSYLEAKGIEASNIESAYKES